MARSHFPAARGRRLRYPISSRCQHFLFCHTGSSFPIRLENSGRQPTGGTPLTFGLVERLNNGDRECVSKESISTKESP